MRPKPKQITTYTTQYYFIKNNIELFKCAGTSWNQNLFLYEITQSYINLLTL